MAILYTQAGLERLRKLVLLHVDEYGDFDIDALSEADGYYTVTDIDDFLEAGLLDLP